jgi:mannosyltransferase
VLKRKPREGQAERSFRAVSWVGLAALLLLALALRFWRIEAESIWYDEGWSIHLARQTPSAALALIGSEGHTHPPGYYFLLMLWTRLFGFSVAAVRGLSALLGTLTVWVVLRLGSELFDRPTGWIAALVLAVAPAHIVYSQETRMYALLALCLALLLWITQRVARPPEGDAAPERRFWSWALLVAIETAAIYTHFFAFLALIPLTIWLLARLLLQARRDGLGRRLALGRLRAWALSQVAVALAFLPWLGVAWRRFASHASLRAQPPTPLAFTMETWSFLMGGHLALYGRESVYAALVQWVLVAFLALALGLVIWDRRRLGVIYLLAVGLGSAALVFVLMRLRPGYHPRYALMLIIPMVLLLGRGVVALAGLWSRRGPIRYAALGAVVLLGLWLASYGLAAQALLRDRYYDRDDARATAAYLVSDLPQGALVWVDNDDWALRYYLEGSGLAVHYLNVGSYPQDMLAQLDAMLPDAGRAALVRWHQGTTDHRGALPFLLERSGTWLHTEHPPGYTVSLYALDTEPLPQLARAMDVNFGPLRLVGASADTWAPADEALSLALTWRKDAPMPQDGRLILELVDAKGRSVARDESALYDAVGAGTSAWLPEALVDTYHTLRLGPGIPPLPYMLQLGVYHEDDPSGLDVLDEAGAPAGKRYILGLIDLTPALGRGNKSVDRDALGLEPLSEPVELAPGLVLQALRLDQDTVDTGEELSLLLEWQRISDEPLPDYWIDVGLDRNGRTLIREGAPPVYGAYPTDQWSHDEVVLSWHDLIVPTDIDAGPAMVVVGVDGADPLVLTSIEVRAELRLYQAPAPQVALDRSLGGLATLVGYDLGSMELTAGEPWSLTLYWRVQDGTEDEFVVFVHLLDETERLIAQHDGPPARGDRPTTGWVPGEYIVDPHMVVWVDPGFQGPAMLEVGLYEAITGRRLLTPEGESRLLLSSSLTVLRCKACS